MRDLIDLANTLLTLHVMSDGCTCEEDAPSRDVGFIHFLLRYEAGSTERGAPLAVEVVRKVFILSQFHIGP